MHNHAYSHVYAFWPSELMQVLAGDASSGQLRRFFMLQALFSRHFQPFYVCVASMYALAASGIVVLQILTLMQQASSISHAFPYTADDLSVFEVLAAQRKEASVIVLGQSAGLCDSEHEISWLQVANYLKSVTMDRLHQHVYLMSSPLVALFQRSRGCNTPPPSDDAGSLCPEAFP